MSSWQHKLKELECVVVIPTYNNGKTLSKVIDEVLLFCSDIIVVNDGSTDATQTILDARNDITVVSYLKNKGKGNALKLGLRKATTLGFRYAITIDSDGQHYADDIPTFVAEIEKTPDALLVGARNLTADNMPGKNTFANKFSNFWFFVETGKKMQDTQSGYRLYPLRRIANMRFITPRYEFELEIIVRAVWRNVEVKNVPVKVFYPDVEERVSHFRPLPDFTRISILNTFLVLIALLYYFPVKFFRSINRENIGLFIRNNITHSPESNGRLSSAVGLGVFFGIFPVWGYQMILAGITAHFLRLNKLVSIAVSNISIPPMIPFILYGSVLTGALVLGEENAISFTNISFETIKNSIYQYIVGSIVLAIVCGLLVGGITYLILSFSRKNPNLKNG